ncbi:putative antigenic thaumatin domain protein [Aspergillus clavatus NRRL 1]|uniref:Antigenic thaumatin domain protein, putative n=1 Tax=Aspergillus clavatus (strain ATCC 1007 / CBS 513.65 / DSM 816 / NCTC 3887 / NRRL 1 / QM 1276 / 107) TaxID=344612 RepID=A1C8Q8_ASPCL|nr:antigenic thaumatin domain protein, putative [Aspergillus clavatus NRRL 1]EAW13695.1 antigenic thaumatin domain protein, putative [Aspergillus clavatus NRRL 1]
MSFSKIFTLAAATFALTASALPVAPRASSGAVEIKNNLAEPVYLWSVSDTANAMQTLAPGASYTEAWRINPNGGGVSIKLSAVSDTASVLQFEYTKSESDNVLYWDLSSIDLHAQSSLINAGFGVTIDDASCPIATCAPGDANCAESYQFPDDHNTRACGANAAFTLNLG